MKSKLTALGIFAAGAGIGAGVALLYAPRTGSQTRKRLRKSANQALSRLEDMQEEVQAKMTGWADEASEMIASGVATGKESVGRVIRSVTG